MTTVKDRLAHLDWQAIEQSLWRHGYAKTPRILTPKECSALIRLYTDATQFRKRIDMARHRFGVGDYQYFADPLPPLVKEIRTYSYPPLAKIANRWMTALKQPDRFPATLSRFLAICRQHGQLKPTPLLLHYEQDGYNCLHQDLYGTIAFPLQIALFLSQPEQAYTGGEFLLVEQRPRAQSRGIAVTPQQGESIIFTTR